MAFDVFISYSHQDKDFRNELEKHLSNLRRQQVINSWYDGDIIPGTEWKQQIIANLTTAEIILLLVSADFMASDFCYSFEMKLAIARHDKNEARVIPIILRPTDWKGAPFAKLKVLPTDGKAVTKWPTHDDAFEDIVQGIRAAVDDLIKKGNTAKASGSPSSSSDGSAQGPQHLGKRHAELSSWLAQTWLKEGPAVCFIEGFSGVGKTSLARDLLKRSGWNAVMVNMPDAGADQADNLFLDLASELSDNGLNEMADAVDSGASLSSAIEKVLRKQILIIIDEFQRALPDDTGKPVKTLEQLFERIANRPQLPGRLLLLSSRLVERSKWNEAYAIRTLSALEPEAAESLLDALLKETSRSPEVPPERRRDVVNWLGCNPRALRVLVASLEQDSLEVLIGLNPDAWELRDREVSPELLERLERELLERTLSHLKAETNTLLRRLSVHRKAVKREAIEALLPAGATFASTSSDLISRFLMEQHSGWFTLNPIVREISLQRLKANGAELQQAHSKAADHYMRHFMAKNIVGGGQLGGYFVEARYHLVQSKREEDLSHITGRFENHLKATFTSDGSVPREENELNERIAVLSALLETPGSKGLEYYLARLYEARGAPGDLPKALTYAQRATGPRAPADSWVLRILLEEKLNGSERALQVCREGIQRVPADKNLFALYQSCSQLLRQMGRMDEAIALLKEGIVCIPADKGLFVLYQSCSLLLAQSGSVDEAIALLKEGIVCIPADKALFALYQSCGELLAQTGRIGEAIALLKEGIGRIPPDKGLFALYQSCGELLAQSGRLDEAIILFQEGMSYIPVGQRPSALYISYGEVLAQAGRVDEAITMLKEGIGRIPADKGLIELYLSCGELLVQAGRIDEAIALLKEGMSHVPVGQRPSALYVSYGKVLAQAGRIDEAIALLQEGIDRIPAAQNLFALYVSYGKVLIQAERIDEAIAVLQEGIGRIPPDKGLVALYQSCGELLAQSGRVDEAITLLQEGIDRIPPDKGLEALYLSLGGVLTQVKRVDEAITLLKEGIIRIPADKSLVMLYEGCAGLLIHLGKVAEAIALLKIGGIRLSSRKKDQQVIVEYILFLHAATQNIAALENYFGKNSTGDIDPQQVALGRVLRLQTQKAWKLAAEAAHQGRIEFPMYSQLYIQEAFSWLCSGDIKAANEALKGLPRLKIDKWSPIAWLKAMVALKNGQQQAAKESLSLYLGRTLADQEEMNVNVVLGLWDSPPQPLEGFDLALYFPTLPPSITGLPHEVTRLEYQAPVLHQA